MAAREAGSFFRSTSARWAGTSETTADSHRNDAIFETQGESMCAGLDSVRLA